MSCDLSKTTGSTPYLVGNWNPKASHDLAAAWIKGQQIDEWGREICRDLVLEDARDIPEEQKLDEACIQFMGGDHKVTLLYENKTHLVVLSTDSSIQVLCVIDRETQTVMLQEESY